MPDKVSPSQFAASVKAKYPEYKSYDDIELTNAIIKKFPEYKEYVDFGGPVPAAKARPTAGLPTFQEQVEYMTPLVSEEQPRPSKYQEAVNKDKSEIGKTASTFYNTILGSFETLTKFATELPAAFPITPYQFSPVDIGGAAESARKFQETPLQERLKTAKEGRKGIEGAFDVIRSGYTTREEEAEVKKFDITDGIGLKDFQALLAMSGGIATDMALGAATGGATFVGQGMQYAYEDFDNAAEKSGYAIDPKARNLYGIAGGVINGVLEKFAVDKIVGDVPVFRDLQRKVIANVLKNTANVTGKRAIDAIEEAAVAEVKKLSSNLKRAGYRALVEGGTEAGQAALEDGMKYAANAVQGNEVFNEEEIAKGFISNVVNSAVAGGVFGPMLGAGADVTFGKNVNTELLTDIANAKTAEELDAIRQELTKTFDENNFSQEERDIIMNNANRYAQIKQTIPEGTPALSQSVAIPKIEQRMKLDEEINKKTEYINSVDEAVRGSEEQELSLLQDRRASLNDEIREIVSNDTFTYTEENGKYYKSLEGGAKEEISKNRYDLEQIKRGNYATKTSTEQIQEGRAEGDIGQRQGAQEVQDQEAFKADIGYSYIVGQEGDDIPITALLNKKVRVKGQPAILYQQGQTVEARIIGTNRIIEIGNVNKLMNELPDAYDIELDEVLVTETPQGYRIEGQPLQNTNENPLDAISLDQNGNVMNVVLTTPAGKRRKFRGQVAKDLAYQIQLKEILKDEEQFEEFLTREHQAELDAAAQLAAQQESEQVQEPTEEQAVGIDETVSPRQVEPTYGRVTDRGADVRVPNPTKEQRKVISDARNVASSLRSLIPAISGKQVTINLHDSNSFAEAVIAAGGDEQAATSRGFYMGTDGSIHINMDNVNTDTVLHEGFHPVLDFIQAANPELINDLFSQLESIPEAAGIIENARSLYQGDITQKKEAITDFVAGVADGRIQLNPSNFQKIKSFILDMLSRIGIGKGSPKMMKVNNEQDLIRLATFVTEKFKVGEEITFDGILDIIGDETVDPINISNIAVVDAAQFELARTADKAFRKVDIKWAPKGINFRAPQSRSTLYDVVSTSGGAVVVINSDATGIGIKNGILRQGGIGYTFIEQNVEDNIGFAASMDSKQTAFYKAVQEAAKIRDERFPEMKGKPVAVFVMVQAPEVMFGNAYGADYFIKSLSYALSNNQITAEDAKADIAAYFNSIKEMNDTGRKYSNSIDKLLNLIETGNLRSPKTKKEIYDLLISNRENNEDKSPKFGFDARRVLFGQFYNKVGNAKNKPGGRLRDLLDKDGFNHKDFYKKFGDENVIKSLEGRTEGMKLNDGGFTMTGFFVDPTISEQEFVDRSKSGKFQHKQFNGKFHGTEPFVLNGKYYVNEVFPEARFVDKNGNPVPVTTSTAGSMYARTKREPQAIIERARVIAAEPQMQRQYADVVNGFYSPIVKKVNEFKQPNASATKWKEIVGFKTDEAVYSGLADWLNSKKPNEQVSKQDVLKFMKDNRLQISEKTRGGDYKVIDPRTDREIEMFETLEEAEDFVASAREDGDRYEIEEPVGFLATRYENYQLPGGKDYKERLVILPGKDMFKSSHFEESNILVHLRMNTRTDSDGKKVLFLEEVQSDWGQQGKREEFKEIPKAPFVTDTNAWVKLGMKIALKEAIKEGADRIAWTTGEQQNDRYDLRKQVDEIQYNDNGDGTYSYSAVKNNSDIASKQNVSIKVIEEDLGKDIADKILASEGSKIPFSDFAGAKSLKGEDLKVGGKGMIAFYGDVQNVGIVGKVAKAVVKELTGKEGVIIESKIDVSAPISKQVFNVEFDATQPLGRKWLVVDSEGGVRARETNRIDAMIAMRELTKRAEEAKAKGQNLQSAIELTPELKQSVKAGMPQFQKAPTEALAKKGIVGITKLAAKEYGRYGVLGKEGIILKEKKAGELSAELATAEKYAKDAILLTKKYKNSVSKEDVIDFMTGQPVQGNLPADLAAALSNARQHVDNLTERLIQLGVIDDQETIDFYRKNKGKYLLRSYEAIDYNEKFGISQSLYGKGLNIDNVAKKLNNVDKSVVDAALKFLADRAMAQNSSLSDEDAMKQARIEANGLLSNAEEYVMQRGLTGSTNIASIGKRLSDEELSPELRALMGEYTDPIYNYYASIFKIASLTSSRQYLNSMKDYGMGKFIFPYKTEDATVQIAGEGSKGLEPLNGLYTFPEIYEALKNADKQSSNILLDIMGRIRKYKTVYNPATHIKNIIGNTGFAISNGHWNYRKEAYKYMRASIVGGNDKDVMRMMDTLNRYGVLNNTLTIGELRQYFKRNESVDDFLTDIYKAGGKNKAMTGKVSGAIKDVSDIAFRKIPQFVQKAYQIEDDLFKILGFVNESNRYAKAKYQKEYDKLSETEKKDIDGIASEIVKDTYPTFTRVPKGVRLLSKGLFLGNFLSFPVESVRVQYNALELARKEIKSGNPRLKIVGLSRMAGALAYNSLFSCMVYYGFITAKAGLTGMLGVLNGDDEDETENSKAIDRYVTPWNKTTDKYIQQFSNGKLVYYDIGSLDSYSYQKKVWNAFWSNLNDKEGFDKAIAKSIAEGVSPFIQLDFAISNISKLRENPNNSIYNPKDDPSKIMKDMSMFVAKQMGPGFVGASLKIADSYNKGEYDKAMNEAYSQIVRRYEVDLAEQFKKNIGADNTIKNSDIGFKDALRNTQKIYTKAKDAGVKGIKLDDSYREAVDKYKEQIKIIKDYYDSAIRGGVPAKKLNEIMSKSGFSPAVKKGVMEGKFNLPDNSYIKK